MSNSTTQCINYANQGLVHIFEIISISFNLLVLSTLFILYILDRVNWQLFSSVVDHFQLVAILPLVHITGKEIYQLYFQIMQYTLGPPDIFALVSENRDYISK